MGEKFRIDILEAVLVHNPIRAFLLWKVERQKIMIFRNRYKIHKTFPPDADAT